jgi:hypothetical protein
MRALVLATLVLPVLALAEPPAEYVPAPASEIPGYSERLLPCTVVHGWKMEGGIIETEQPEGASEEDKAAYVRCSRKPYLEKLSLRELSILRNTIFARYGWGGFRKPWLREHFQKQPWFKPDRKFSYKRLSPVDRLNAELIAQAEMSLRYVDLESRRDAILASAGKGKLSPEDRIELGLISRAMGEFAVDEGQREDLSISLDKVLPVKELRLLSLRDLRLLRNTIYARRGRPFKSPLLQEHFSRMPWYTPDPAYTDKRLTKTDKRNVALIQQVEKEFGGALKDKDFLRANPSQAADVSWPEPEPDESHEPPPGLGV